MALKKFDQKEVKKIMATYKEIQNEVLNQTGKNPKTCWIAHAKKQANLPLRKAPNRSGNRKNPCPPSMLQPILNVFKKFKMI